MAVAQTLTISGPSSLTETDENFATTYTITRTGPEFASQVAFDLFLITADTTDQGDISNARLLLGDTNAQFTAQSADVSVSPTRITFAAGDDSKTFSVTVVGDNIAESAETFAVYFFPRVGNLGDAVFVTITDDDVTAVDPDFSITVDESTRTEGQTAVFTVTLAGGVGAGGSASVEWTVSGAGITSADYAITGADTDGTLTFTATGTQTLSVAIEDDDAIEASETLTITLRNASAGAISTASASTTITDNDALLTLTGPATVTEGATATYTVTLTGVSFASATTVNWMVTHSGGTSNADLSATMGSVSFATSDMSGTSKTFAIGIVDDNADNPGEGAERFSVAISVGAGVMVGIGGSPVMTTIAAPGEPQAETAERTARVTTQLAGFAKAATQLTAQAVSQRLNFSGANTFNLGQADTAEDILRQSSFSLAHGNGGINLWASGNRSSASGTDNSGVTYDGDATALHLGVDTTWNDGLLGIAVSQSSGDTDFKAGGINSKLESSVVTLHPYLTRKVDDLQLWAAIGYGTGEAKLQETENNVRYRGDTDLSLLSAAAGLALAVGDNASFTAAAQWSKTEWDAATLTDANNRTRMLPKGDASALRLDGGAELGKRFGDWRPFFTVNIRRDSGDGDDGNAADYGAGLEWQSNNVHLRLSGRKHAQGRGPDEEHLTLTARKTSGKLNLGLNLTADDGINTGNLLTGELRF